MLDIKSNRFIYYFCKNKLNLPVLADDSSAYQKTKDEVVSSATGAMNDANNLAQQTGNMAASASSGIMGLGSKILGSVKRGAAAVYSHIPYFGSTSSSADQQQQQQADEPQVAASEQQQQQQPAKEEVNEAEAPVEQTENNNDVEANQQQQQETVAEEKAEEKAEENVEEEQEKKN